MEGHTAILERLCRICGLSIGDKSRKKYASDIISKISLIWPGCNIAVDSPVVHPQCICVKCRLICENQAYSSTKFHTRVKLKEWTPHSDDCPLCKEHTSKKEGRGRPLKRKRGRIIQPQTQERTSNSETDSADESTQQEQPRSTQYSLFMNKLKESLQKISKADRDVLLDELALLNDSAVVHQSMLDSEEGLNDLKELLSPSQKASLLKLLFNDNELREVNLDIANSLEKESKENLLLDLIKQELSNIKGDKCNISSDYKDMTKVTTANPSQWLKDRNSVVRTLVCGLSGASVNDFQKCLALEHLYSLSGCSFISIFSFMTNLTILAITNSKTSVNMISKILPGGCYVTLKCWMKEMGTAPTSFPKGDCLVAIDNDQIVPKRWKVKVGQKSRVSIVTSVCQAEISGDGTLEKQSALAPRNWKYKIGDSKENKDLSELLLKSIELTPALENVIAEENKLLIQSCLEEVAAQQKLSSDQTCTDDVEERVQAIMASENTRICPNCGTVMDKNKRKCINSNCRVSLKAAEKHLTGEDILGTALIAPLRQYNYKVKEKEAQFSEEDDGGIEKVTERVSATVKGFQLEWDHVPSSHPDKSVRISVSDPCFVNPSSQKDVIQVLRHVGGIAKITRYGFVGEKSREWLPITMDGSPYLIAIGVIDETFLCLDCASENVKTFYGSEWNGHIKTVHNGKVPKSCKEFDWVVLSIGPLHVEMNMVKHFFNLNWQVFMSSLAIEMGFESVNALQYIKAAGDHHKAMTLINVFMRGGWCEMLVPYVKQRVSEKAHLSVSDFLTSWLPTCKDPAYKYMYEQLWRYAGGINVYHIGIRRNNTEYVNAGLQAFAPFFSWKPYTSKYQLIELRDRCMRTIYPDELGSFLDKTESISVTGNKSSGEGMDARLEEVNKSSKSWEHGSMTAAEWLSIFRNHDNLVKLRHQVFEWFESKDPKDDSCRSRDNITNEVLAWRVKLRREGYLLSPYDVKPHKSVEGILLDEQLQNFTATVVNNRSKVLKEVLIAGKKRTEIDLQRVFVTPQEREKAMSLSSLRKVDIVKRIEAGLDKIHVDSLKEDFAKRFHSLKKRLASTKKDVLIAFCEEVERSIIEVDCDNVEAGSGDEEVAC